MISTNLSLSPCSYPRLPYITILCLVKDAAAKLSQGEGTRADICDLLRESQYVLGDEVERDGVSRYIFFLLAPVLVFFG